MRKLLTLTVTAALAAVMGMSGSAWAGPLEPTSYDMLNGEEGTFTYYDEIYSGAGDPAVSLSPLSGGLGDLTDDVFAADNWFVVETAPNGPYVGWTTIDPTITFNFAGPQIFDTVTIHVDDSDGAGTVSVPLKVEITVGSNSTQTFAIAEPGGSAPVSLAFAVGGEVGDTVVVKVFRKTAFIMVSEVDFDGEPAGFSLDVEKTLLKGPDGATDVDDEFGTIEVSLADAQSYEFEIKITNTGGADAADGGVVFDVIPAEYNLDPAATAAEDAANQVAGTTLNGETCAAICTATEEEDFSNDELINADCTFDSGTGLGDGTCDGTPDSQCDDGICDGIINDGVCDDGASCDGVLSDNVACMPSTTTSGGGGKKGGEGLEPEFVTIEIGSGFDFLEMCTIMVRVVTDENPASQKGKKDPQFEPTGCHPFLDKNGAVITDSNTPGIPIVDWIALNDGVKVFDPEDGALVSGPTGSIQLRPVGCDTDGDGVPDVSDPFPLDPDK